MKMIHAKSDWRIHTIIQHLIKKILSQINVQSFKNIWFQGLIYRQHITIARTSTRTPNKEVSASSDLLVRARKLCICHFTCLLSRKVISSIQSPLAFAQPAASTRSSQFSSQVPDHWIKLGLKTIHITLSKGDWAQFKTSTL